MSKLITFVLIILSFQGFGQKLLDPAGSISIVTASVAGSNSSIASAYSIRQLKTTYDHPVTITAPAAVSGFSNSTTPLLRVRRSSDNGQLDIGYDGDGNLDSVLLKNFVSNNGLNPAASGFVTVWYDQSGNSRDLYSVPNRVDPGAQPSPSPEPRIVNAGVVERNSGGVIGFYGINGGMLEHRPTATTTFNGTTGENIYGITGNRTMNVVSQPKAYTNGGAADGSGTYLVDRYGGVATANGGTPSGIENELTCLKAVNDRWALQIRLDDGSGIGSSFGGSVAISTNRSDNVMVVRLANDYNLYVNGVLAGSVNLPGYNPMSPIRVGYGSNTSETVYYGEFILFPSALPSTDLNVLNINQGDYYFLGPPPNTWRTDAISSAWNNAASWTNATIPDNLASVTIPSGTAFSPIITSAVSIKKITIASGATLTVNTGGNLSISDSLIVNGNLAGGGTGTVTMNGGIRQVISGSGTIGFVNLTISNTLNEVVTNNNINITGTLTVNANATFAPIATAVINSAAPAGVITGNGTVKVTRTAATADYQNQYRFSTNTLTNLIVDYAGLGNQTINLSTNHGNVAVSGTGVKTLSAAVSATNVTGNLSVTAATLDNGGFPMVGAASRTFSVSNGATFRLSGTTSTYPTGFNTYTYGSSSTVEYAGSGAQTIVVANYGNLTSSNSGARTLANSGTIGISGTFTKGTNSYTITSSTIDYNGTGAQTIADFNYNNLTISGARGGSNITLATGTIGVLTTMSVTASSVGSYIVTGNTVNFSGAAQTVPSTFSYNNLTLSGTDTKTTTGVSVNGILSLEGTTATLSVTPTFGPDATLRFDKTTAFEANTIDWPTTFNGAGGVIVTSSATTTMTNTVRNITYALSIESGSVLNLGSRNHECVGLFLAGVSQVGGTWGFAGQDNNNTTFFANSGGRINNLAGVKTWSGLGADNNWTTSANWNPVDPPTATNDVIIPSGTPRIPSINTAATCRNLTNNSGATLNYTSGSLTIASNYTNNGTANFGACPITFTGGVVQTIGAFTTTGAVAFQGTSNQTVGTFSAGAITVSKTAGTIFSTGTSSASSITVTSSGATINIAGALTLSGAFILNSTNATSVSLAISGSGNLNAASLSVGSVVTPSSNATTTITFTAAQLNLTGNLTLRSSFDAGGPGRRNNPVFNHNTGSVSIGGSLETINNNANTMTYTMASNTTLSFAGATPFVLGGGTNTLTLNASGCIVNYNGSVLQTLPATALTYATMKVNNATGVTLGAGATIPTLIIGDITANSIFNDGGFTISSPGALTLTSGTYNLGSAGTATTWPAWSPRTLANGTTIGYVSGVAQEVTTAITYRNLAFSGAGTKNVAAGNTLTVNENWSTTGGLANFTNTANAAVTGNVTGDGAITVASGTISVGGAWTNSGTLTPGTGTINYNGVGAQTVGARNYNNLTISTIRSGSPVITLASGTIGVSSTFLTTASGVTYSISGNTINYNGAGAQSINAFNYNNLTISGARGGATVTFPIGTVGIAGTYTTSGATNVSYSVTDNTIAYNAAIGGQSIIVFPYNILTLDNTSGTQTAAGALSTSILNNSNSGSTLNMGTFALTATTINNTGTIRTQNTTATPIPTGLTM